MSNRSLFVKMKGESRKTLRVPQANDPALGINSWLEDELFHQYQFDHGSVDEGWTRLFEENGENGAHAETPYGPETPRQEPPQQPPPRQEPPQKLPPEQEPPTQL